MSALKDPVVAMRAIAALEALRYRTKAEDARLAAWREHLAHLNAERTK